MRSEGRDLSLSLRLLSLSKYRSAGYAGFREEELTPSRTPSVPEPVEGLEWLREEEGEAKTSEAKLKFKIFTLSLFVIGLVPQSHK